MSGSVAYLDTSAFVKLVIEERETRSLVRTLERWPIRASSTLLRTETVRALRRAGHDTRVGAARRLFAGVRLVRVDEPLLDRAGELPPWEIRTLDAIHLASALALGDDLAVFITYDTRVEDAARASGILVDSPRF
jgi:predicted nucleic acid-binding protein